MANRICSYAQHKADNTMRLAILTAILLWALAACSVATAGDRKTGPEARYAMLPPAFASSAQQAYSDAKARLNSTPDDPDAAWKFARACFDLAEFATNSSQRAQLAKEGVAVCRQLISRHPSIVQAHYYLGLNLGQLARTQTLGALRTVEEMERALKRALELDARFDYAGPDRSLGLLYLHAPGWPVSVGDRRKARRHLEQAVRLSPDYPDNRLCLLEACLKWNDIRAAIDQKRALDELLPRARTQLIGDQWDAAWEDWNARFRMAQKQLEDEHTR